MSAVFAERLLPRTSSRAVAPAQPSAALRSDEIASMQSDRWYAGLSEPLRHAIEARARVRRVSAGTTLAQRGQASAHWVGVARGAVRLGTPLADGRSFTLDFIGPGQWFGDIAAVDHGEIGLDLIAHVPSTVLEVPRAELRALLDRHDELREALLQLNCRRLRYMVRRFEELHTLALPQRLARELQRLAQRFGRPVETGVCIELAVSQGDLAALVGGSRQRVNRALGQMQQAGIVKLGTGRLLVRDVGQLAAMATDESPHAARQTASDPARRRID